MYIVLKLSEIFQEDISTRERSGGTEESPHGPPSQSEQGQKAGMIITCPTWFLIWNKFGIYYTLAQEGVQ